MSSWKSLLLRIGEKSPDYGTSSDPKEHIETCFGVLRRELEHSPNEVSQFLLQCAEQLPHKTSLYGTVIGLLNLENEEFVRKVVENTQSNFQDALDSGNCNRIRLLMRFLTVMMCSKVIHPSSLVVVFETLLSSAATTVDEEKGNPSWQSRADFYITCILSCLSWGGADLIEQVPEEIERVMVGVEAYLSKRKRVSDTGLSAFEDDDENVREPNDKDFLEDLWGRIQVLSSNGWKLDSVPRPHLSFEAQLVDGKSHEFGPISCPDQPDPPSTISSITCGKQKHDAELIYPQRIRRLNIFPASKTEMEQEEDDFDDEQEEEEESEDEEEEEEEDGEEEEENGDGQDDNKDAEMEELEKEYVSLRHQEQDILKNLKHHKDEDLLKGQAVKNQKALWDKTLEFRFLLQKAFSSSNRLPQEPVRSLFCDSHEGVNAAYSDLVNSSKRTLDSLVELEEALLEKNPSIVQATDSESARSKHSESSNNVDADGDEDWSWISQLLSSIATFRNKSIDKWQRKTQVTTGAAAIKSQLHAFNQNISEQVASYMRDPSRMVKQMQMRRSAVGVFGIVPEGENTPKGEETQCDVGAQADGDPELLDDSEFYQQLLKEFFETIDPTSSETAFYSLKKLHTKKRKIVDRRASKSRKIRYNVHEKIVNFLAPERMTLPTMVPDLNNLFGLKNQKRASVV
ncbi:protein AATF-like isoform X1 [Prunus avium]|uniref:Protein AATF-like isoform X1 n=1 Tax=Prunus avium TaxID=42229 RepID=A0A6P5T0W9_PRUAV|nr:protein AATF-like isoform X1 [Prunus avium]